MKIQGTVEEIVFANQSNGFTVADLNCNGDLVTVVGIMPLINPGETIEVEGEQVVHPDYGEQIKVKKYRVIVTHNQNKSICKFLASGIIKGIGPVTAKKLVEHFGKDTLDIIRFNPEKLTEVEGIGPKKAEIIARSYEQQSDMREVILFLQKYNVAPSYAMRIYKKYGQASISVIKENPYRLAEDITGIGFKMADNIAMEMGIQKDSPYRIAAGIKYMLTRCASDGHCYLPYDILVKSTCRLLDIDSSIVMDLIEKLSDQGQIIAEKYQGERIVYSNAFYAAETNVCKRIIKLCLSQVKHIDFDLENDIKTVEFEQHIQLAKQQKEAVRQAVENGVLVITGGPGTGKTTIINTIINIFTRQGVSICLAAPTGRAAKRMTEATGREAKTIHRLLEYGSSPDQDIEMFARDESNPLDTDVVIIDEVSMVDILLMNNLLKAITPGTRLILVGDVDQLPSVGPGNVLKDIIDSGIIKTVRLNQIFRQAKESMIIVNAHRINQGLMPNVNIANKDFYLDRKTEPADILEAVIQLCCIRLPKHFNLHPLKDIQVLSPMKKGTTGVLNLNVQLQKVLNPPSEQKKEYINGKNIYRVGDKVMQIKNNYQIKWRKLNWVDRSEKEGQGIFNGDVGYIQDIHHQKRIISVVFDDDKLVNYEFSQLDELRLAYAISVHKSQGSEFAAVIIPMCWGPPMLMTRNLLYTAVTRAKNLVVIVGREDVMHAMISNNHITKRFSALNSRLKEEFVKVNAHI